MDNYEQQLKGNPLLMSGAAVQDMASGNYTKAYERFEYLAENYNEASAWLYMGYMNELGMGTSQSYGYAKTCYGNGADLGEQNCVAELRRINSGDYLDSRHEALLRQYFQNIVASSIQSVNSMNNGSFGNNYNSGSSHGSHSSGEYTCPTCHGRGLCTVCGGKGYQLSGGSYIECTMCHGSGQCYGCHGKGYIR